ncbi:hypothetical protein W97_05075 [Coniosporium apollinis CBS 100218]|uniref:Uncharacterized protein n=1 Tax=Coniosporium apollinis (strain CBS 100218) TaxID=1168221 RepID=R7YVF7_CONA1|nr:uncharacterized protein W97_05075 [Coniosporium apollinis CBS 100218]EON65833.1 hypothetical protein W97_05075 [Coniosporium apollinis CBS 100218]
MRKETMDSYYKYMSLFKPRRPLFEGLQKLAIRASQREAKAGHRDTRPLIVDPDPERPDLTWMLPNEIFEYILSLVFSGTTEMHSPRNLRFLSVSYRFLVVGLRALLTREHFVFSTSRTDHQSYLPVPPGVHARQLPSASFRVEANPERSILTQVGGVLWLPGLCRSTFPFIPDPLLLLWRVRIIIELPGIMNKKLDNNQPPPAVLSSPVRRVVHPYVQRNTPQREQVRWIEVELSHERAEYHFSILKELPFKNLKMLELDFSGYELDDNNRALDTAVARWIGRYLHRIDVVSMAKEVDIITAEHSWAWAGIVKDAMVNGLRPWVGDL